MPRTPPSTLRSGYNDKFTSYLLPCTGDLPRCLLSPPLTFQNSHSLHITIIFIIPTRHKMWLPTSAIPNSSKRDKDSDIIIELQLFTSVHLVGISILLLWKKLKQRLAESIYWRDWWAEKAACKALLDSKTVKIIKNWKNIITNCINLITKPSLV